VPNDVHNSAPPQPSSGQVVLHLAAVVVLSAYPLSLMLRENIGIVPIGAGTVFWVLVANLGVAGLLFLALRLVTADLIGRLACVSAFMLVFGAYNIAMQAALGLGWRIRPENPAVAVGYAGLAGLVAALVTRPWRTRRRDAVPLIIVGTVLVGANAAAGASRWMSFSSVAAGEHGWQRAAGALVATAGSGAAAAAPAPSRDIFYIVLDGFGSARTLERFYGVDATGFVNFLTSRGFHVPARARSNYGQTYLSLASTLNLDYLDDVAAAAGTTSGDRTPLAYLIDHNALMDLARRAGYRVVGIGSDYIATERLAAADVCICDQFGSSMTEQAVLVTTPLVGLSLGRRAFDAHRRKVLGSFEAVTQSAHGSAKSFVFAHIVVPHPPFVFEPDGSAPPRPSTLFVFQDGSKFPGTRDEYRDGYRKQVGFVMNRIKDVVDTLLSRPGPPPVIILHGDHGPGSMLDWDSAAGTNMAERLDIFAAYHLPGARTAPHDTITPLNGARLLANEYLGAALPLRDDRSFYSTWDRPYDFVPIAEPGNAGSPSGSGS
jgi:hypothetical protein